MFERFSDRARRAIVLSQEEARLLDHAYIGTEHLLLGLIHEDEGVAAQTLESLGVTLEKVRALVEEIIGLGGNSPSGHIPFTPRAKKVIELSLRETLTLGHNYIGTEHLLLALAREGEGVAMQVITKLGIDEVTLRAATYKILGTYQDVAEQGISVFGSATKIGTTESALGVILRAYTLAGSERMSVDHLKQALQELDGT